MNSKILMIFGGIAAVIVVGVMLWRNTPYQKALRLLNKAAEIATVTSEDSEIARRVKAGRLRQFIGYEVHVDVEGVAQQCDLMQEDVLAAWAYVVGATRHLNIDMVDLRMVEARDELLLVNVEIQVESNYQNGAYSRSYPVTIELMAVEGGLRVSSINSR